MGGSQAFGTHLSTYNNPKFNPGIDVKLLPGEGKASTIVEGSELNGPHASDADTGEDKMEVASRRVGEEVARPFEKRRKIRRRATPAELWVSAPRC